MASNPTVHKHSVSLPKDTKETDEETSNDVLKETPT
jgi:hypothetical protein